MSNTMSSNSLPIVTVHTCFSCGSRLENYQLDLTVTWAHAMACIALYWLECIMCITLYTTVSWEAFSTGMCSKCCAFGYKQQKTYVL